MHRGRQAVNVNVTLYDLQDTAVAAHLPGTSAAALGVRVGGAMVMMHDHATVELFAQVWTAEGFSARRLPRARPKDRTDEAVHPGPAVMVEAAGSPAASASLLQPDGSPSRLRVELGRITFYVRDYAAYKSTTAAFRRAAEIAPQTFLPSPGAPVPGDTALAKAAEVGARAFAPPVGPHRRSEPDRRTSSAARSASAPRPDPGGPTR